MSEDLQTIPARHGTATFVPKGSTIKIVNTSGTQVIDTWAFVLPSPPTTTKDKKAKAGGGGDEDDDEDQEEEEGKNTSYQEQDEKEKLKAAKEEDKKAREEEKTKVKDAEQEDKKKKSSSGNNGKITKKAKKDSLDLPSQEEAEAATRQLEAEEARQQQQQQTTPAKSGWSSYLPSLRRGKPATTTTTAADNDNNAKDDNNDNDDAGNKEEQDKADKKQQKENSKTWGSYLRKGQGVTSYLPSKTSMAAFAAQHARDPNKTYAEQLADFSRTPVGAASLSAITGSGSVSSLYAGYSAWNQMHGDKTQMEHLSMSHTRASTLHMIPRVNDVLVSNLREPMLTLIEDTSAGIHDTLIPACDPQRYKALNVENWEEHGSCAENLVLALKELNQRAGLKGAKGVGASVTVNSVPAPLNLFMSIPWKGDKGDLSFEAPKGKEGDYVRFRAERDVVVIMSACPNDVQQINKGQSKDGHFLVEHDDDDASEDDSAAAEVKKADDKKTDDKKADDKKAEKKKPRKLGGGAVQKKDEATNKAEEQKSNKKNNDKPKPDHKTDKNKKSQKPEEQKQAEKIPLPETPAVEKSEQAECSAAAAPPMPKPKDTKPKKAADTEEQKKAASVPLPETPALEKSESASSPAPLASRPSVSGGSDGKASASATTTPKPKGKPKKLVDSTTGEKKKPRKLEPRSKNATADAIPKSSSASGTRLKQEVRQGDKSGKAENGGS